MRSVFETPPMFLPCRLKTDISPPSEGENSKFQGRKKPSQGFFVQGAVSNLQFETAPFSFQKAVRFGGCCYHFLQKSQRETDVFQVFQNNSPPPFTAGGLYAILKLQKCNTERK